MVGMAAGGSEATLSPEAPMGEPSCPVITEARAGAHSGLLV